ncbi:DUF4191 domain-containing protein [Corynebacterium sp. A21]|uniref:DUF4191 domain-containing protein n=1 Tax=Corynebacterium sp. A21 TaxID=3457318 RepID=UPI003FD66988
MADAKKQAEKAAKKEARKQKRAQRTQTWKQLWQAFNIQRKQDKKLIPYMALAIVGLGALFFFIGLIFNGQWWMLPIGIAVGFMLAMFIFTRRLESSMYDRASEQAGSAGWAVENLRNSPGVEWRSKTAVAATTQMDAVHRVVGVPGVVLVGEGEMHRLRPLLNQQKKRINRIAGGVPVYEIIVGEGEDRVQLRNLQRSLLKLPRNYKKNEVGPIAAKIEAMDNVGSGNMAAGLPKGPMPKGASMSGMNRRTRRASERREK